jgi:hypothetical protein
MDRTGIPTGIYRNGKFWRIIKGKRGKRVFVCGCRTLESAVSENEIIELRISNGEDVDEISKSYKRSGVDRFMSRVNISDDCWEWMGGKSSDGYGCFNCDGKATSAHRYSYALYNGEIPPGMEIDHACNNRACVNPKHLRLATRSENCRNARKRKDNTTGYKGVSRNHKGFTANIFLNGHNKLIGVYDTAEEAYRAYLEWSLNHYGKFANDGNSGVMLF